MAEQQRTQAEMVVELRRLRDGKLFVGDMAYVDALVSAYDALALRADAADTTILKLEGELSVLADNLLAAHDQLATQGNKDFVPGEEVQAEVAALGPAGVVALDPPEEEEKKP